VAKIYEAALELFAEKGYAGTSMRDLGNVLRQHPGNFYSHINGKEDILFGIIKQFQEVHQRDMKRVMDSPLPPVKKLKELITCHVNLIVDNPRTATVYFHEWQHLGDENRKVVIANRDRFEDGLETIIADCVVDGSFADIDVSIAAKAALGMLNWTFEWWKAQGRLSGEEIAALYSQYIVDGLRARAA
jgi:AcrR family transcriptional regulator